MARPSLLIAWAGASCGDADCSAGRPVGCDAVSAHFKDAERIFAGVEATPACSSSDVAACERTSCDGDAADPAGQAEGEAGAAQATEPAWRAKWPVHLI